MFLRDNHWRFFNVLITLTLTQVFWKTKPFLKNWRTVFYLKLLQLKTQHFHTKLTLQKRNVKTNRMGSTK